MKDALPCGVANSALFILHSAFVLRTGQTRHVLRQVHIRRAGAGAAAAADAADEAQAVLEIGELVHDALPPALALLGARVVARRVQREQRKAARIPAAQANAAVAIGLVLDVEARARRADIGAAATAEAA